MEKRLTFLADGLIRVVVKTRFKIDERMVFIRKDGNIYIDVMSRRSVMYVRAYSLPARSSLASANRRLSMVRSSMMTVPS